MKKHSSLGIISPIIIAVLTALVALALYWIWIKVKEERIADLKSTISILKGSYELAYKQRELSLISIGNRMLDIEGPDAQNRRLKIGHEALEIYDDFVALGLANPDGSLITFTGNVLMEIPNLSRSDLTKRSFERAKTRASLTIGEPYYFEQVSDWVLPVRVPIKNKDGDLIAVNTSAIRYKKLLSDIADAGINEAYKVHAINTAFNTTQLYYPLELEDYEHHLRREVDNYENVQTSEVGKGFNVIRGFNTHEMREFIGVEVPLYELETSIIVSVDRAIIINSFWDSAQFVLIAYFLLSTIAYFTFKYLDKKEYQHQQAIETEKANLKSLFESTSSIIGLFDQDKKLIEFNRAFAEYAKATDNVQLKIGLGIPELTNNPEMRKTFNAFQDRALAGEKFKETVEYPTEFGTLYFLLSYNPIYRQTQVVGLSMFVDDITELKNSQKELERYSERLEQLIAERTSELRKTNDNLKETNRDLKRALKNLEQTQDQLVQSEKMALLGVLAAGVGHEINNPLNFIHGGIRALEKELVKKNKKQENIKRYMSVIDEGVKRCAAITESLGNYSRQGTDMNENCDVQSILENCLTIIKNELKHKVSVNKDFVKGSTIVKGNQGKLHQVFLNILTNAEQAIENTGAINIAVNIESEKVIVRISDDGVGISKEDLEKISDPFFTTKSSRGGTGLGLSIAYSIINEHHGTISCQSALGKGTEFTISLPVAMHMN